MLPRMADSAICGEAISQAMGYKENEFLNAYYNNIRFQNAEVIDSNPLAFAIKKLVEHILDNRIDDASNSKSDSNKTLFIGTPAELLSSLEEITVENKISTSSREWPKDHKWLVRRINLIKANLQQDLDISVSIERDSKNTSIIKIEKNVSNNFGENKMSPENELLTPYLEEMSPETDSMTPDNQNGISRRSIKN